MNKIKSVLIVGGTHGNELSGITYVNNHINSKQTAAQTSARYPSLSVQWHIANHAAIASRTRYCEDDLNRQFTPEKLTQEIATSAEQNIAFAFNKQYGPKGDSSTDLVIDIHNTTSNMGPTLILLESDEFHQHLASFVKSLMPEAIILIEDEKPFYEHKYLCTIGKRGLMIEVGPQPQGVLRAQAYIQTKMLCEAILAFCEQYNDSGLATTRKPVEAFRLIEEIAYPKDDSGNISAMIHPELQDKDFEALDRGMPMFLSFNGDEIKYEDANTIYPHFIGEAAYYHLGIAMASAERCLF